MANWIPMQVDLSRRSEVIKISEICGHSRHHTVGMLLELWGWFSAETVDGHVDARVEGLSEAIGLPTIFVRAVIQVKWLTESSAGLCVPNWDRWLSKSAKSRVQKTLRQKAWRGNVDASVDASVDGHASTRGQERTGEKNLLSKESNKEGRRFVEPTLEEVSAYCRERGNEVSPDEFIDFYSSKGWMIGKNKMKDWQSAVRTWEKRAKENANSRKQTQDPMEAAYERRRDKALADSSPPTA